MMPSGVQRVQSPSYDSAESKCQCGAGESCIPLFPARLYLTCGALCFKRKGIHGYMEQFSSDLLEQVPVQTKYSHVKCLLQCFQVRIQQTITFKFLLCLAAVHWSCPLPALHSRSGFTPRGNVLLRHKFQLQWGNAHTVLSPCRAPAVAPFPYCQS